MRTGALAATQKSMAVGRAGGGVGNGAARTTYVGLAYRHWRACWGMFRRRGLGVRALTPPRGWSGARQTSELAAGRRTWAVYSAAARPVCSTTGRSRHTIGSHSHRCFSSSRRREPPPPICPSRPLYPHLQTRWRHVWLRFLRRRSSLSPLPRRRWQRSRSRTLSPLRAPRAACATRAPASSSTRTMARRTWTGVATEKPSIPTVRWTWSTRGPSRRARPRHMKRNKTQAERAARPLTSCQHRLAAAEPRTTVEQYKQKQIAKASLRAADRVLRVWGRVSLLHRSLRRFAGRSVGEGGIGTEKIKRDASGHAGRCALARFLRAARSHCVVRLDRLRHPHQNGARGGVGRQWPFRTAVTAAAKHLVARVTTTGAPAASVLGAGQPNPIDHREHRLTPYASLGSSLSLHALMKILLPDPSKPAVAHHETALSSVSCLGDQDGVATRKRKKARFEKVRRRSTIKNDPDAK